MSANTKFTIEKYESGYIYGWFFDESNPNEISTFEVEVNEQVIAIGVADIFRPDLLAAGFGDGVNAFKVFVESGLIGFGDLKVRLRDKEGGLSNGATYQINRQAPEFDITYVRQDPVHLHFIMNTAKKQGHFRFELVVQGKESCFQNIEIKLGVHSIIIAAPISLMDGNNHFLSINLEGGTDSLWHGVVCFEPLITPLEHVKNAKKFSRLMTSNAQASFRYASLKLQLEQQLDSTAIKNISTAHSALVEGWHNRKNYPTLTLPKYSNPIISIIIPAHNKFELTYHCIASIILAFDDTPYEVILADDYSSDETKEAAIIIENLKLVSTEENLMFLLNCNQAATFATGKYLLFLNNDTEVTSHWLKELVDVLEDNDVGLVGSKLLNDDGSLQEAGGIIWDNCNPWNVGHADNPNRPEFNYVRAVDYISGASLCIKKTVWEEVEGFSEYLVPAYFEDADIAFKVRRAGYKTLYAPQSEVFHFEGMTHGTDITKGVKKNQVINASKFAKKWASVVKFNGKEGMENLHIAKDRNIEKRVLMFDYTMPDPSRDAGSYAAIQEIKLMQSLGFKVTFAADNLAHLGQSTIELQRMGVEVLYAPFYMSLEQILATRIHEMDAVYITRFYVAEKLIDRIKQLKPSIPVIFNNADLHFLRELRAALQKNKNLERLNAAVQTRQKELEICQKADVVLCYNSAEKAVIISHILEAQKIHITPWVLEPKLPKKTFSERKGITFLGGFGHLPNVEAVEYLTDKIMPLLYETRPEIVLYVYGSKMPDEFKKLETENIKMIGFAESLHDVYENHRVFVAPLLSGAGIKGKVLEAMAYNLPCVLTDIAAEGTGLTHAMSCFISNSPEEWVDKICELYDDESTWQKFADNEKILVKQQYSFENGKKRFAEIFESVGIYTS